MPDLRRALLWRGRLGLRIAVHTLARRMIEAVVRLPPLHRLPRRAVALVERALIATARPGVFDAVHYLTLHDDVRGAGMAPLTHYLLYGQAENRAPRPDFDPAYYRTAAGLRPSVPVSPLAHHLAIGRRRGIAPAPVRPSIPAGRVVSAEDWRDRIDRLPPTGVAEAEVDIVMPVHSGRAETLSAIWHVLAARNRTRAELVVVDDCGPDPELRADIAALARDGRLTLLRHRDNRGFVAATNTGMALHEDRDVVWLNADTEVYDGWLDRLRAAALAQPRVATVTPLTNNGTICSYPRMDAENPVPPELRGPDLDRMAARVNRGVTVETPTAVGFATYVRRAALRALGPLDEAAFGAGYGEENDFSQRAIRAGWINLIAADVYVRHIGATSFGAARAARIDRAMAVLDRRYPDYHRAVGRFLRADPLAEARGRLDRARLLRSAGPDGVLLITHSLGGGTEQHVQEEIARFQAAGRPVFVLRGGADGPETARLSPVGVGDLPSLDALDLDGAALWHLIARIAPREIHVHHLADFAAHGAEVLAARLRALAIPYDVTIHDYLAICPRINLADNAGRHCGEPGERGCRTCLALRGSPVGAVDIAEWRAAHRRLLDRARRVIVPDTDVATRLARYLPGLALTVRPHERLVLPPPRPPRAMAGPLRIGTLGAIGAIKGFDVLLDLAGHLRREPGRASLTVIGYTRCDRTARAAGIDVTGPYTNDQVPRLIEEAGLDVILLPALWPETYSYTLSLALRSGLPIVAFDLGAIASRLRVAGRGHIVPFDLSRRPADLLDRIETAAGRRPATVPLAS